MRLVPEYRPAEIEYFEIEAMDRWMEGPRSFECIA
jgi:hypothetical protein